MNIRGVVVIVVGTAAVVVCASVFVIPGGLFVNNIGSTSVGNCPIANNIGSTSGGNGPSWNICCFMIVAGTDISVRNGHFAKIIESNLVGSGSSKNTNGFAVVIVVGASVVVIGSISVGNRVSANNSIFVFCGSSSANNIGPISCRKSSSAYNIGSTIGGRICTGRNICSGSGKNCSAGIIFGAVSIGNVSSENNIGSISGGNCSSGNNIGSISDGNCSSGYNIGSISHGNCFSGNIKGPKINVFI